MKLHMQFKCHLSASGSICSKTCHNKVPGYNYEASNTSNCMSLKNVVFKNKTMKYYVSYISNCKIQVAEIISSSKYIPLNWYFMFIFSYAKLVSTLK